MRWGYPLVEIGDLVSSVKKWNPRQSKTNELINYIDIASVNRETKEVEYVVEVFAHEAPSRARQLVIDGDVLVSTVRPNLNAVAHLKKNFSGATASTGFTVLRSNSKKICSRYLYYWVRSPYFVQDMIRRSTGASYPAVSDSIIKAYNIPLPSLEEQKRIAAILDKADAIRRKRKEAIRLTEELLRSTFLDMFGDPVTNPKGWDKSKLSKLGCVVTGNTPPRANLDNYGDDIEWIKSDNITTPYHFLTYATERLSSQGKKIARIVPPNSILVACIAGSRSSIGRAALADREVAFNQQINAIVPNSNVDPYFLYTHFFVTQHLVQAQSTNSMKGLVSKSRFSNIEFIQPPEQKQREFGKWFSRFHSWSNHLRNGEEDTDNLFNSLLQKAFRGEL